MIAYIAEHEDIMFNTQVRYDEVSILIFKKDRAFLRLHSGVLNNRNKEET